MRYSRQTILAEIGEEGQKKLRSSSVLIVGLGGLGAPAATYLVGAGVGRVGLADNDVVSLTNLQRQTLYTDCCDNFATRYLIDDTCTLSGKPWVHGSIGEFHGQVSVFNHSQGRRYAELYPDRDALCALPRVTTGVLGAVPGVIGAIEASEALKILAGFGTIAEGTLFTIDLLTLRTTLLTF